MEANDHNDVPTGDPEDFLENIVEFPDGSRFERLEALTDLRKDSGPGEARILYLCRLIEPSRTSSSADTSHKRFVMKVKAQWPGPQNLTHAGPSPWTLAELKALQLYRDHNIESVPHLTTWKKAVQPHDGVYPGGYLTYTIMTLMPGQTLWNLGYWSMPNAEREEIQSVFMVKLKEIRALGIAPYDCALRNILWDRTTKRVSIVDFEHYEETTEPIVEEKIELQKWGLVSLPPPRTWFQQWGLKGI